MSEFSIGSYVRVINKNLESYGLIGQVINPEEYFLDYSDTCVYICFEQWHNESEKILKIKKKNVEEVESENGGSFMKKKLFSVIIVGVTVAALLTGCQGATKSFGGSMTLNLEPNQKLEEIT